MALDRFQQRRERMKIALTKFAGAALLHALGTKQPKGRPELRQQERLQRACRTLEQEKTAPGGQAYFEICAGAVEVAAGDLEFLVKEVLYKQIDAGIPGGHAQGYGELLDAVEPHFERTQKARDTPAAPEAVAEKGKKK